MISQYGFDFSMCFEIDVKSGNKVMFI